ncbi:MAG: biotin/lipoyl-binding protein [Candidatus Riflebacteria bacterium]|nr:biotin/lipoyl-binding protein [Candidatus Riflebacteria bacterium]
MKSRSISRTPGNGLFLAAVAALMILTGCGHDPIGGGGSSAGRAVVKGVGRERVTERQVVEHVEATGTVRSRHRAVLASKLQATVLEVLVREGDGVRTDQVLVRLDDKEMRALFHRSEATLIEAREALNEVGRSIAAAQQAIEGARAHDELARPGPARAGRRWTPSRDRPGPASPRPRPSWPGPRCCSTIRRSARRSRVGWSPGPSRWATWRPPARRCWSSTSSPTGSRRWSRSSTSPGSISRRRSRSGWAPRPSRPARSARSPRWSTRRAGPRSSRWICRAASICSLAATERPASRRAIASGSTCREGRWRSSGSSRWCTCSIANPSPTSGSSGPERPGPIASRSWRVSTPGRPWPPALSTG